jgi:hypothetical protein
VGKRAGRAAWICLLGAAVLAGACNGDDGAPSTQSPFPSPQASQTAGAGPGGAPSVTEAADAPTSSPGTPVPATEQPPRLVEPFWIGVNNFALASASDVHSDCGGPANEQSLDAKFSTWARYGVGAVRFWAFQSYATNDLTGQRDWTAFDRIFARAHQYGVDLIPVLGNDGLTCDWWGVQPAPYKRGNAGACSGHWYDTGYKQPYDGYRASYRDWVTEIVSRYAGDPALKVWEVVNEPNDNCSDVIRHFFDDATALVRAADPVTPVSLGASARGESWTAGDGYRLAHANPNVTWATAHDYGYPDDPFPISPACERNCMRSNFAAARALGKPFYIGEAGIDACDTEARAQQFRRKIVAMRDAGVQGFVLWDYQQNDGPLCDEAFGPDSPIMRMIAEVQGISP